MFHSPLEAEIVHLIQHQGPLGVDVFHDLALFHSKWGYYRTSECVGYGRDFITSPEVSSLFGEMVGAFCVDAWLQLGQCAPFSLIELGPGSGVLMADILRVAEKLRPNFTKKAQVILVEINPAHQASQSSLLTPLGVPLTWVEDLAQLERMATGPCILIANEFFDVFAVSQTILSAQGERMGERQVHWDPSRGFYLPPLPEGARIQETSHAQERAFTQILRLLKRQGGVLWVTDYGPLEDGLGDSWQGVRRGERVCPLSHVGKTDLSAHVPFGHLKKWADGFHIQGPVTQRDFLLGCGLHRRLESACARTPCLSTRAALQAAFMRLVNPLQMGTLFKTMVVRP